MKYVYQNGYAIRSKYFTVKYVDNKQRKNSRYAVVISKKVHKSAVGRNRVRRRVYEYIRTKALPRIRQKDIAVIVTSGEVLGLSAHDLDISLNELFSQID